MKEVADVLQVSERDFVEFYLDDGEIVIRKVLPKSSEKIPVNDNEFWEWVRKKKVEISMIADPEERDFENGKLDEKIEMMKDYEESRKKLTS